MTTATDDGQLLLKAIIANPADDTARLVYADWLQEQGRDERAELVRVQVELAVLESIVGWNGSVCQKGNNLECSRFNELCARESAILAANPDWRPKCVACDGKGEVLVRSEERGGLRGGSYAPCTPCSGTGRIGTFRRGWLDSVEVPRLADVLEQYTKKVRSYPADSYGPAEYDEVTDWRPTPWAERLVREHPLLTRVVAKDRKPATNTAEYYWVDARYYDGELRYQSVIPSLLIDRFPQRHVNIADGVPVADFDTEPAALDALAVELCDTLKERVGVK